MQSSEQILEVACRDGSIDIAEWPRVLETLLQRLHDIVHNDFPIPIAPLPSPIPQALDPEVVASTPPAFLTSDSLEQEQEPSSDKIVVAEQSSSQDSAKENDAPKEIAAGRPPDLSSYSAPLPSSEAQRLEEAQAQPSQDVDPPSKSLPPDLLSIYQSTDRVLRYDFSESPPYTIQRLAELVLHPKKHYRFLPAYLRALDRVVAVSSPVTDFPLPLLHASTNGGFLTNGDPQTNGISERDGLGSDESLGGALLTPIPWLRNQGSVLTQPSIPVQSTEGELRSESSETIDGPHGAGRIETVTVTVNGVSSASATPQSPAPTTTEQAGSDSRPAMLTEAQLREQGGLTQGELLRKEQEAGIVPIDNLGQASTSARALLAAGAVAVGRGASDSDAGLSDVLIEDRLDDLPHARGPDVIGMEDMGPQQHPVGIGNGMLDMEAAVGRGRSKSPQPPRAEEAADDGKVADDRDSSEHDNEAGSVESDVEKLKEAMVQEAMDGDGDSPMAECHEPHQT